MLKVRYCNSLLVLILLLLLVMGCNFKSPKDAAASGENSIVKKNEKDPKEHDTESLNAKLDNLLNTFGISEAGKRSIVRIKDVVTDVGIGSVEGYRNYTDSELYALLNDLGAAKIQEIIKADLELVKTQKTALEAINNVHKPKERQNLQLRFNSKRNEYPLHLKGLFNESDFNVVYSNVIGDNYVNEFTAIKEEIIQVIGDFDLYKGLSSREKSVVDYIQSVVTNANFCYANNDCKTYTLTEFYALLNSLGDAKIREMIKVNLDVFKVREEIEADIAGLTEEKVKQALKTRLASYNNEYAFILRGAFNASGADNIYSRFMKINYINAYINLKKKIRDPRVLDVYTWLSDEDKGVIDKIQGIVTDSNIGHAKGYKTYTDSEFNDLLNNLGASKTRSMITAFLRANVLREMALEAINTVPAGTAKQNFQNRFNALSNGYALRLKGLFNSLNHDMIYDSVVNDEYSEKFLRIKDDIRHLSSNTADSTASSN
ncbi:BTA121 domain-containing protein surface lipoprotein [Borrelia turicatae]|uniref:BTA121 domain-containing protein surface lipoprotein n=1 Tax=Borrelia turicatae TaxID=142 RepID=UPI002ED34F3D